MGGEVKERGKLQRRGELKKLLYAGNCEPKQKFRLSCQLAEQREERRGEGRGEKRGEERGEGREKGERDGICLRSLFTGATRRLTLRGQVRQK